MSPVGIDPQLAVTIVAILGAVSHATVAILRAVQDYQVAILRNGSKSLQEGLQTTIDPSQVV